jgi:hypothetical protein
VGRRTVADAAVAGLFDRDCHSALAHRNSIILEIYVLCSELQSPIVAASHEPNGVAASLGKTCKVNEIAHGRPPCRQRGP